MKNDLEVPIKDTIKVFIGVLLIFGFVGGLIGTGATGHAAWLLLSLVCGGVLYSQAKGS